MESMTSDADFECLYCKMCVYFLDSIVDCTADCETKNDWLVGRSVGRSIDCRTRVNEIVWSA
jgi:hypothetical protein